jgi:cyclin-dependent kinase
MPQESVPQETDAYPILPETGARVGRYVNVEHFRDGVCSEVFRANDPTALTKDGKPKLVALKISNPAMMTPPHDTTKESRILNMVKGNHIISLLETFTQPGGSLVLVFPYMPYDLSTLLCHHKWLTPQSRRTVLRDIFSGLAHIHEQGIIHRDIKPSNILLSTPSGPAYLADLGIAWSPHDGASEPADEKILDVGTTCYRPPELLFGHTSYGLKLDMWAAGCVAAQIVCLNEDTLFDAGDLGSELALIRSIFQTIGTPNLEIWPEAENMPDWGKMNFTIYPPKTWEEILPEAGDEGRDLVRRLVQYESRHRLTAEEVSIRHRHLTSRRTDQMQALKHPYVA